MSHIYVRYVNASSISHRFPFRVEMVVTVIRVVKRISYSHSSSISVLFYFFRTLVRSFVRSTFHACVCCSMFVYLKVSGQVS